MYLCKLYIYIYLPSDSAFAAPAPDLFLAAARTCSLSARRGCRAAAPRPAQRAPSWGPGGETRGWKSTGFVVIYNRVVITCISIHVYIYIY